MQQIEFETEIRENFIKLPDHLTHLNHKRVRVIIFENTQDKIPEKKLPTGFYSPLRTQSYRIIGKREEIYER